MDGEFDELVYLILGEQLKAFSIWVDYEDPWEDEAPNVRVSLIVDSFDISVGVKLFVSSSFFPVSIFLPSFIGGLFKLVVMLDSVGERSLAISASYMDIFVDV